jgi:DNA replication protein DnaC
VDLTDPERPWAVRDCRVCDEPQRLPLFLELDDGRVEMVPPSALRWVARLICEECDAKEQAAEEALHAERTLGERLKSSGIPAALADEVSWESIITKGSTPDDTAKREKALELAREWAADPAPGAKGIWLYGSQGSGKTRLVATAVRERLQHLPIRWVSVAVLITQLDGAWNDEDRKAALKVLTDPGVVVLDDLDKIVPSPRVQTALFVALESREQSKVGISVTSNESPGKVAEMFSSPFMSRLVSMAAPLAYPGPDRRLELDRS